MATTLEHNLYPPLVVDTIPAFVHTEPCKIYFSLSMYNTVEDIRSESGVHVSLVKQSTNTTALKASLYPSKIMLKDLEIDENAGDEDYKYYVTINPTDLQGNDFEIDQFYIAQLRFTSSALTEELPQQSAGITSWLYNNKDYFSEWSTICLLRGIEQPLISTNLDEVSELPYPLTALTGKLYYQNNADIEQEYLKSYSFSIKNNTTGQIYYQTDEIYTNIYAPNEINYNIEYDLPTGVQLQLTFIYTTNNLYSNTETYTFAIAEEASNQFDATFSITPDESHGRIKLDIDFENGASTNNDLVIRRASSRTDFHIYDKLAVIPNSEAISLRYIWYDNSIESGVYYKYRIQENVANGNFIESKKPVICVFEDIFLTCGDRQLKIQFNPSISQLKYNTMESQQTTLGSQYPFVRRNGNNYFRTFSISGLVSSFMDDNGWYDPNFKDGRFHYVYETEPFTSKAEIYKDSEKRYQEYNEQHNVSQYEDYIYEREFRQKVMDFLYKNDVKLFRSLTEGNILIKLMSIGFQPVDSLGRRLYSFSASAVEIDALTALNYNKYNIINTYYHGFNIGYLGYKTGVGDFIEFSGYQSIIDTIKNDNSKVKEIYYMEIQIQNMQNAICYVKHDKIATLEPYTASGYYLTIESDTADGFIEDCWFSGAHLEEGQYTFTGKYYGKTEDVENPVKNGVYEIADTENEAFKIDDYISYNNRERLLTTTRDQVDELTRVKVANKNNEYIVTWALFVQQSYSKYIYYNNKWYPFSDNGDVLMPIKARIKYYYEEKGVIK